METGHIGPAAPSLAAEAAVVTALWIHLGWLLLATLTLWQWQAKRDRRIDVAVRRAIAEYLIGEIGHCGAPSPLLLLGAFTETCRLPAGHEGWHRCDPQYVAGSLIPYSGAERPREEP